MTLLPSEIGIANDFLLPMIEFLAIFLLASPVLPLIGDEDPTAYGEIGDTVCNQAI